MCRESNLAEGSFVFLKINCSNGLAEFWARWNANLRPYLPCRKLPRSSPRAGDELTSRGGSGSGIYRACGVPGDREGPRDSKRIRDGGWGRGSVSMTNYPDRRGSDEGRDQGDRSSDSRRTWPIEVELGFWAKGRLDSSCRPRDKGERPGSSDKPPEGDPAGVVLAAWRTRSHRRDLAQLARLHATREGFRECPPTRAGVCAWITGPRSSLARWC